MTAGTADSAAEARPSPQAEALKALNFKQPDKKPLKPVLENLRFFSKTKVDSRAQLENLAGKNGDTGTQMQTREEQYLENFPESKRTGLRSRYDDVQAHKAAAQVEMRKFAQERGINLDEIPPELTSISFENDTTGQTEAAVLRIVDKFFNSEQASRNPEKLVLVQKQTQEYLQLLRIAQAEGSIPKSVSSTDIFKLVSENVSILALQDRAASENLLGDHGVRHLIGHNINASMQIADSLKSHGAQISAMDKLLMHQIMIYHDLGYALGPVRNAINQEGIKGQDAGHNLLGAQYVRERFSDSSDTWQTVLGQDQQNPDILHRGVLYHDRDENGGAGIHFTTKPEAGSDPSQVRISNIESIIRTADNTHAFEDKLPELLYRFPETIKYMRLMQTAGEIGDEQTFLAVRRELAQKITATGQLSADDRESLTLALLGKDNVEGADPKKGLQAEGYKFVVGRICGNKPEFALSEDGINLIITVQASSIHQETVGLFGQESYTQLKKFIGDLQGVNAENVNLDQAEVRAGNLIIRSQTGEQKAATEATDFQQKISELRHSNPALVEFANQDTPLSLEQTALEKTIKMANEGKIDPKKLTELISPFMGTAEPGPDLIQLAQTRIGSIKLERQKLLKSYRNPG